MLICYTDCDLTEAKLQKKKKLHQEDQTLQRRRFTVLLLWTGSNVQRSSLEIETFVIVYHLVIKNKF